MRVESKAQVAAQSLEPIASYNVQRQDTATEPATTDPVAAIEAAFLQAEAQGTLAQAVRKTVQGNQRKAQQAAEGCLDRPVG